ncbi:MAG: hypothetical protein M1816_003465 [Peltula sp. TS41687]|nr:MAG: hypothetical protein M1816_003465 [Peltula sp. TS41687]
MSAPGSAPLGPPGPPAPGRSGTTTPALPSAPRRLYCLRHGPRPRVPPEGQPNPLQPLQQERFDLHEGTLGCLKTARGMRLTSFSIPPRFRTVVAKIQANAAALPDLPSARRTPAKNALVIAAATLGSRVDKHNRRMKDESGGRKPLSLVERSTLRFQESLLARPKSVESAYRTAHGQPPAALDDSDSDDEDDDAGDGDGDSGDGGVVGAGS